MFVWTYCCRLFVCQLRANMNTAKRKCYSIEQKSAMLQRLEAGDSNFKVAKEFGVSHSTISSIKKNKHKIEAMVKANILKSKRFRTSNHKQVEHALLQWLKSHCEQGGAPLSRVMIQERANSIARQLNIFDFNCSPGWINRFKIRHNISTQKKSKGSVSGEQNNTYCKQTAATVKQKEAQEQTPANDTFGMLNLMDSAVNPEPRKICKTSASSESEESSPEDLPDEYKKSFEVSLPLQSPSKRSRYDVEQEEDYDRLNIDNTTETIEDTAPSSDIWDVVGKFVAVNGREWAEKNYKLANHFKAAIYKIVAEFQEKAAEFDENDS